MVPSSPSDRALDQARLRLARSRQALLEQMHRCAPNGPDQTTGGQGPQGLWPWLMQAWQHHPVRLAVQAIWPLAREQARRRPLQLLTLSTLLGAALVLLRPWRLLPLSALLMMAVRTVPLSQLLSAWLHQATQDAQSAQAGSRTAQGSQPPDRR